MKLQTHCRDRCDIHVLYMSICVQAEIAFHIQYILFSDIFFSFRLLRKGIWCEVTSQ